MITEKQQRVLDFIKEFKNKYDTSPTTGDIAKEFDYARTTCRNYLYALKEKGFIKFTYDDEGRIKGIKCLDA